MSFCIESQAGLSVAPIGMITAVQATAQRAMRHLEMVAGERSDVTRSEIPLVIFRISHQSPIESRIKLGILITARAIRNCRIQRRRADWHRAGLS